MAKYEFDVVTEVEPYTKDNQHTELNRLFKPLTDQGVTFMVIALEGAGGGHPTVQVEGDIDLIREHMQEVMGWEEDDEQFEELYRVEGS